MKSAKTWLVSCTALALLACHQPGASTEPESAPPAPEPKSQTLQPGAPEPETAMPTADPSSAPVAAPANRIAASGSSLQAQGSSLSAAGSGLSAQQSDFNIQINLSADVLFDFDKAELKPEADVELQKMADVIAQKGKGVILITGHTDGKGSDAYNLRLSLARAEAVKNWLIARGLQQNYQTEGKGAANPVAPNTHADGSDNPEGRAKNRRVEIVVNKTATLGGQ
ncbi:OmpA family protein [Vandammella animalimorsus]|uniref:Cell envelope biogenesis protein OmpA n=1 Tax=Vandammella animalimorsus TaxID=2029117 RepID=A0A2A2AXF0_9BURK|nr:OmpA family protein [Vandammella animalimorsus]PAT42427.1 cell envelope biogenesis protein OmpA [Vandammella animalimorsus]